MIEPLTLVLSMFLASPAAAATQRCHLSNYELGPKGLSTSDAHITNCGDVDKLSPEDQQEFWKVRKAINNLPPTATSVPPELDDSSHKFLTKGEIQFIQAIQLSAELNSMQA